MKKFIFNIILIIGVLLIIILIYVDKNNKNNIEINKSLKDPINLKLAVMATTLDYSLKWINGINNLQFLCYSTNEPLINGCSRSVRPQCVSFSQQNACQALDIRLKKQGYSLNAADFVNAYIFSINQSLIEKQNEEINKENKSREILIQNLADGK